MPKGKKVLIIVADIVFVGNFIERLLPEIFSNDYVVSIEPNNDPYSEGIKNTYFDTKQIESNFPQYCYPGYFFNAGQMFLTIGAINQNILNYFFDVNTSPYWKNLSLFPLVDQSVYNYLLPTLASQKELKLGTAEFMLWNKGDIVKNLKLIDVINKRIPRV